VATESESKTTDELKAFLKERGHPIVATWKEKPVAAEAVPTELEAEVSAETHVATVSTLPLTMGGYKIILKDAKIYAKKVIIRSMKGEKLEEKGKQ
ncbi:MAG: acetyl-CoA decarbonylase/synthase complex subunit beta, partial [Candidatus Bathyarchaeia archaeon]